jgi:hypothetical protein
MTRTNGDIHILHPVTGECVRVCRGPSPSGACPLAGPDGVVPCAGYLIAPAGVHPESWPLPVPQGYRHCDVTWNQLAQSGLHNAERARERWQAGLARETERVRSLAAAKDPRYRKMTDRELEMTALWRWRPTGQAQSLRRSEERNERQAHTYLDFVKFRRNGSSPGPASPLQP